MLNTYYGFARVFLSLYCQAQQSPGSSFSLLADLALFSFNPATFVGQVIEF
jgi:hypothetical protein